jgi:hypothetical protein
MRILHAGNFGSRAKGAFLHSVAAKLSRGLTRAGHHVVDFADRDVARAATPFGARKFGVLGVNAAFTRLARDMRPDLLVLGHADTLRPATIAALRKTMPALRVLQWNVDPLFEPDNVARLRAKCGVVDATLVSTAGDTLATLRHPGMRLGFLPNPVDFSIETGQAHLQPDLPYDLFFACGHPTRPRRVVFGEAWDMEALFAALARKLPALRLNLAGLAGRPPVFGHAYQSALGQTAMGLNVSRRNDVPLYSSDRLAQLAGNGLAVLIDRATGYDRLFTDHEMAFFASFDELAAQLRRLAADPAARCALAAAGRARYHALFNETLIARYLVDMACGTHNPKDVEWPSAVA